MTDMWVDLEYKDDGICVICRQNPVHQEYVDMCKECVRGLGVEHKAL